MSALAIEQAERTVAELPGRLSAAQSLEAQAMMCQTAIGLLRQLVEKRDAGVPIPQATIDAGFDAVDAGVERMIAMMPGPAW